MRRNKPMNGEEIAAAADKLHEAIKQCLARSKNVSVEDGPVILNLLAGKLRAQRDKMIEQDKPDADLFDEDELDEEFDEPEDDEDDLDDEDLDEELDDEEDDNDAG
jgi:translation initiation factor IF-1